MKGSDKFKETIKEFLDDFAKRDGMFAERYGNPKKNMDECVDYILTTVHKSGCNGFDDAEIYGMAVHYYEEENPGDIRKGVSAKVVVNHRVELTEEEKEEARRKAVEELKAEEKRRIQEREKRAKEAERAKADKRQKELEEEGCLFQIDEL